MNQDYVRGFMDKCASRGINPQALIKQAAPFAAEVARQFNPVGTLKGKVRSKIQDAIGTSTNSGTTNRETASTLGRVTGTALSAAPELEAGLAARASMGGIEGAAARLANTGIAGAKFLGGTVSPASLVAQGAIELPGMLGKDTSGRWNPNIGHNLRSGGDRFLAEQANRMNTGNVGGAVGSVISNPIKSLNAFGQGVTGAVDAIAQSVKGQGWANTARSFIGRPTQPALADERTNARYNTANNQAKQRAIANAAAIAKAERPFTYTPLPKLVGTPNYAAGVQSAGLRTTNRPMVPVSSPIQTTKVNPPAKVTI